MEIDKSDYQVVKDKLGWEFWLITFTFIIISLISSYYFVSYIFEIVLILIFLLLILFALSPRKCKCCKKNMTRKFERGILPEFYYCSSCKTIIYPIVKNGNWA